jgi:predicted transcriptional regulator
MGPLGQFFRGRPPQGDDIKNALGADGLNWPPHPRRLHCRRYKNIDFGRRPRRGIRVNWRLAAARGSTYFHFFAVVSIASASYDVRQSKIINTNHPKRGARRMSEEISDVVSRFDVLRMTVDIVAAYISRNPLEAPQIPDVIHQVFVSLVGVSAGPAVDKATQRAPAVPVRRSVMADYIVCLEDGRKLKMLKRHLKTAYNLTPDEYRSRWKLPSDYPMVAPSYAQRRSDFAKKIGLGRKAG